MPRFTKPSYCPVRSISVSRRRSTARRMLSGTCFMYFSRVTAGEA